MHDLILKIGYAIIDFFTARGPVISTAVEIAGVGMLGIFVVIGVIVAAVLVLNKIFSR